MNRAELLKRLRAHKTTLIQNFSVTELALFGSFARDQAADDSDVDVDRRTYDATLRNLELIGEVATHIPDAVRQVHPNIQWRSIKDTRNHLAHNHLGIDDDIIWNIIQTDIPNLLPALRNLLDNK